MSLLQISEPGKNKNSSLNEQLCLGIDFGTTNCVCSIKENKKLVLINDEFGKHIIPTIVSLQNKNFLFGNQVKEYKDLEIDKLLFSIKRKFIKAPSKKIFFEELDKSFSPIEISSMIFSYLKTCCENFLKKNITKCVITVPAYFDDISRSAIKDSASLAGFEVLRLINEPTAAAYAYGLEENTRGYFFVYDLGGGTFDVSILKLTDGVFKVLSTGGDPNLGGDDFDENFASKILSENLKTKIKSLTRKDKISVIKRCKIFKEKLEIKDNFDDFIFLNGKEYSVKLSKKLLNTSIKSLIERTIQISKSVLTEANITLNDLSGIIFVGGSTRLDLVKKTITEEFNLKTFSDINPDLVVAKGAALHAHSLVNGSNNLLLDITPLSLGIETAGGLMEKIIERNSTIPIIKEQEFTTYENGQTAIKIHILQGERETVEDNRSLGEFILKGIDPKPPGIPRIKVRFVVDANGILSVTASEESSGVHKELEVKPTSGLNIKDMKKMIEDSITHGTLDIEKRLLKETKIDAQRFLNEIGYLEDELIELTNDLEMKKITSIIFELKESLELDDRNKIQDLIKKIDNATKKFSERRIKKSIKSALVGKKYDNL